MHGATAPEDTAGFRKVKPKRKQKDTPSRLRRDIRRLEKQRQRYWNAGDCDPGATERLEIGLSGLYESLRALGGDPGNAYKGHTTAPYAQPPTPTVASTPGRWPTRRLRPAHRDKEAHRFVVQARPDAGEAAEWANDLDGAPSRDFVSCRGISWRQGPKR